MNDGLKKRIVYGLSSMIVLAVCGYYIAFGGSAGPCDAGANSAVAQVIHRSLGGDKPIKKTRQTRGLRDREPINKRVRTSADVKPPDRHGRRPRRGTRVEKNRPSPLM